MTKLHISEQLDLPQEVVTEKVAFIGRTGSGKSYAAQKLAEEMHGIGAQFVVIDPVGIWWGLRLSGNGKDPGIPIPLFGGLRGDIPLEAGGGALIANLIVDRGVSAILDVSQFESDADKARFAHQFADRFFFRKKATPSAVHVFLEECQEFVPQNPMRDEARMLHAFTRLEKLGRNFGVGMSLISQRPQEVNKKALNQTELLFCFQMTGPQERKTVDGWIAEKGIEEDIAAELPKLEVGKPHVWSPAWLRISKVVPIARKWTFDASSTPRLGKQTEARALSPIDLERLREDMASTIERAKEEDPRELRKRIAELERKLRERPEPQEPRVIEVPVLQNGQLDKAKEFTNQLESLVAKLADVTTPIHHALASISKTAVEERRTRQEKPAQPRSAASRLSAQQVTHAYGITSRQQRFLDAAATLTTLGAEVSRDSVSAWIGVHPRGGSVAEELKALQEGGYLVNDRGLLQVTEQGMQAAAILDPADAIERAKSGLSNRQARFFAWIAEAYPNGLRREQIAEMAGIHPRGGSLAEDLGRLVGRGLVERCPDASYRARDFLFA